MKSGYTKAALAALLVLLAVGTAFSANKCVICHQHEGLSTPDGPRWLFMPNYRNSVHAGLECLDCHKGIGEFPHPGDAKTRCDLPCHVGGEGHGAIQAEVDSGPHAGFADATHPACTGCHDSASAKATLKGPGASELCLGCHDMEGVKRPWFPDTPGAFGHEAHRYIPETEIAPDCVGCHGAHVSDIATAKASCTKGGCHEGRTEEFAELYDHGPASSDDAGRAGSMGGYIMLAVGALLALHLLKG